MRLSPAPIRLCVLTVGALLMTGCANLLTDQGGVYSLYEAKPLSVEYGKASFYGGRWIGRLTANGEHYHSGDCTAAHKKLPFNTMVRVTNLRNGKTVIVRINNRGPYAKGRILDLSVVAARQLDMMGDGIIPVKAEVLKKIEVITKPNRSLSEVEQKGVSG
jgi:rare lipoprotein A